MKQGDIYVRTILGREKKYEIISFDKDSVKYRSLSTGNIFTIDRDYFDENYVKIKEKNTCGINAK